MSTIPHARTLPLRGLRANELGGDATAGGAEGASPALASPFAALTLLGGARDVVAQLLAPAAARASLAALWAHELPRALEPPASD